MLKPFSCVEVCYLVGLWLQLFAGKGFFRTGAISLLYFQGKERNPHLPLNSFTSMTHSSISLTGTKLPLLSIPLNFCMWLSWWEKAVSKIFFWNHLHLLEIRNLIAMVSCCFDCQSFIHYVSGNRILVLLEANCPCLWASHSGFLWTHLTAERGTWPRSDQSLLSIPLATVTGSEMNLWPKSSQWESLLWFYASC